MKKRRPTQILCDICDSQTKLFLSGLFDDRFGCPDVVDVLVCSSCGHFTAFPRLEPSAVAPLYEKFYGRTTSRTPSDHKSLHSRTRRWIFGERNLGQFVFTAKQSPSLLDVGSGDCQNLWDAVYLGFRAVGYDVDKTSKEIGVLVGLNVRNAGSISDAFAEEKFDLIQLNQVIEHYLNPGQQLEGLKEHLVDGGRVFISTPNAGSVFRRIFRRRWINWHVPYHQHHFTKRSLRTLLERDGWEIVSFRTVTPLIWFVLQLRRATSRPRSGHPSSSWNTPTGRLSSTAFRVITAAAFIPIRILDIIGVGDSLAVVIRRKQ